MTDAPAAPERASGDRVEIIACHTCGGPAGEPGALTRGELLLAALRGEVARSGDERFAVSSVRCLWACTQSCAVHVRGPGRHGYVLVRLEPTLEMARALLAYCGRYLDSADGAVPYKSWPPELKGHFLCRIPRVTAPEDPS